MQHLCDSSSGGAKYATVATCTLNQWAMDFDGNLSRVCESIERAKRSGARLRLGPELELCGYGCEDHYFESDTLLHCWESIVAILSSNLTDNILCDIGMPVLHEDVRYNCRVMCLNRKILLIRPKMCLADEGNYRESRWFTAWSKGFTLTDYILPSAVREVTGQRKVPFGVGAIAFADTAYSAESCEELFTANNPGITLGLSGVEIIGNGSGSHFTIRKRTRRLELIEEQTRKNGGIYLYANQKGCDGGRLYFDGTSIVCANGETLSIGPQFEISDVHVSSVTVSLNDVRTHRSGIASRGVQAAAIPHVPRVESLEFGLTLPRKLLVTPLTLKPGPLEVRQYSEEEEFGCSAASWLWDYLRRSGMPGYFLPLSGGVDSAATATCVALMCQQVTARCLDGDADVLSDVRRVTRDEAFTPHSWQALAHRVFYCVYMSTEHSSNETRQRAAELAAQIGCRYLSMDIDPIVQSFAKVFADSTGHTPNIRRVDTQENIACQNVQARSRMVLAYLCAQMLPVCDGGQTSWPGTLLVLGSANLDEAYRGYYTKFDCSAADLNPIGGVGKTLLKKFLLWAATNRQLPALQCIVEAKSSAELQPTTDSGVQAQVSEDEMGITFDELDLLGKLRTNKRCGPLAMFYRLQELWRHLPAVAIGKKVKDFFRYYSINRHKVTTLPPAMHVESSSCDDNRYDLRQFLYNVAWTRQFRGIDAAAARDGSSE